MLTKQEKQRNFFKSIVATAKKSKEKEYIRKSDETYETATYKEVTLNLPTESLEEIEGWSNEVEE